MSYNVWSEYDSAAQWCAQRGLKGTLGDRLPFAMSGECLNEINQDPEAFQRRVKECAFALAMKKVRSRDDGEECTTGGTIEDLQADATALREKSVTLVEGKE